jgi:hypothetical protein
MLLTITTTHRPATDLAPLLHADPYDVRSRRLAFGETLVFFPQYDRLRSTAAVLLEPRRGCPDPTTSSLAVAVATMFDTALEGRTTGPRELTFRALPFQVEAPVLPASPGPARIRRLFEPLGYRVSGGGVGLHLAADVRLSELLAHLCVLLPVLDDGSTADDPGQEAVSCLLAKGDPWLGDHPHQAVVARRYLGARRPLPSVGSSTRLISA